MAIDPLASIPRSRFRLFQADSFQERAGTALRQFDADAFQTGAQQQVADFETRRQAQFGFEQEEEDQGFWGGLGSAIDQLPVIGGLKQGGGTFLGGALDILGRPQAAVAGSVLAGMEGRNPLEGFKEGILREKPDLNFATVLERAGLENEWARNILGLGLDILTDPLNIFMFGAVRGVTGRAIRGLGRGIEQTAGRVPVGATTVSSITDQAFAIAARPVAKAFSARLGTAQGGETYWEIRRMAKLGQIDAEGAEHLITVDRIQRNVRREGGNLARSEAIEGIMESRFDELVARGMPKDEAMAAAEKLIKGLQTNTDLNKALNHRFLQLRDVKARWDDAAEAAEKIGLTVADLPGASSVVRFLQGKMGRLSSGELGDIVAMKEEFWGVFPVEEFYYHAFFPDYENLGKTIRGIPSLVKRLGGSAKKRVLTAEQAKTLGVETNVLLNIAHDIAQTRLAAAAGKVIDDKLLAKLGRRVMLTDDQLVRRMQQLRVRGFNPKELEAAANAGESIEAVAARFQRTTAGLTGTFKEFGKSVSMSDEALIREYLENIPRLGEGVYVTDPQKLFLLDEEAAEALVILGDAPGKVKPQGAWILPEEISRSFEMYHKPFQLGSMLRVVDAFNNMWKPTVTVFPLFVSFFTRNFIGLIHKLGIGGMMPHKIAQYGVQGTKLVKGGMRVKMDDVVVPLTTAGRARKATQGIEATEFRKGTTEFVRECTEHGGVMVGARDVPPIDLLSGETISQFEAVRAQLLGGSSQLPGQKGFWGGMRRLVGMAKGEKIPVQTPMELMKARLADYGASYWKRHGFHFFAHGTTANQSMDNAARYTYILWRIAEGDTVAEAAQTAAKFIGNYTELGAATGQIASLVPFFRWTRYSVPLEVEALLTRPYVGAKVSMLTGEEAAKEQMNAEGSTLPEWVLERHHVLLGEDEDGRQRIIYGLGLPIEDLNKIFAITPANTVQNMLSELSPIIRFWIEWPMNQSFFTGEPVNDKDSLHSFYRRAWNWTADFPGLKDWLQVSKEVSPTTGETFYRCDNPVAMYTLASFFGRFGNVGAKGWDAIENRSHFGMQAWNLLTGMKMTNVFPESPSISFEELKTTNPFIRSLWQDYSAIPLYPQLQDPQVSQQAARAINKINSVRLVMERTFGREVTWEEAASRYGEYDQPGEALARMVKRMGWTQRGRADRQAFLRVNPKLHQAMSGLSPEELEVALGQFTGFD